MRKVRLLVASALALFLALSLSPAAPGRGRCACGVPRGVGVMRAMTCFGTSALGTR
ncbi:hypothetical protein [Nonomuraea sp. PA05]|uniref:hypothetical protein n=1 Tax=Nonomuraea sp. PA05 TaxID=2604466 RepID=UPI001651D5C8|nr:hypothetical protein [Nonomuraea sp. PA05]